METNENNTSDDPFAARNQHFEKAVKPEECKSDSHDYGVRKYGFCASCNSVDLKLNTL